MKLFSSTNQAWYPELWTARLSRSLTKTAILLSEEIDDRGSDKDELYEKLDRKLVRSITKAWEESCPLEDGDRIPTQEEFMYAIDSFNDRSMFGFGWFVSFERLKSSMSTWEGAALGLEEVC